MSDDPFLDSLLEAGRSELPEPARIEAIASKLGAVVVAGGGGAAAAAGNAAAGKLASNGVLGAATLLKGTLAVALLAGAGSAFWASRPDPVAAPPPPLPTTSLAAPAEQPSAFALPPLPSASVSAAPSAKPPHVTPPSDDPEAEAQLLHRAQDALSRAPAQALALGQEHARRFPRGLLVQEREVLAIDALLRLEHRAEAERRAEAFARAFPNSSHRRRIETLLATP